MKVLYERSFLKDLRKNDEKALKERIESVISEVKRAKVKSDIKKIEKLRGHNSAFKIRIGNYRLGLFIEGDTIIFSRLLHRKEIYKKFP